MKYRGVAYYPEYWQKDRWDTDIRLMKEANINFVRIVEFAWSSMEPKEREYNFDWLHEIITKMEEADINVMLCTPTATPPAWLTLKHPEVCRVTANGERHKHGMRRHYCPSNKLYRKFSCDITKKMADEFKEHKNIIAWQLDNELGGECFCESCQEKFRIYLKNKYKTIENLNSCWKTKFWSLDYSDWSEIRMEEGTFILTSLRLECRRFNSNQYIEFATEQEKTLRLYYPNAIIETNGMGPIFDPIDYYLLFKDLDVACDDLYFDISTMDLNTMALDIFRQIKPDKEFWITETGTGALDESKVPDPLRIKEWALTALAHGCSGYSFFRWRTCLSGQEQELQGLIEYNGLPKRRYQAAKNTYDELAELSHIFENCPLPTPEIALFSDYNNIFAYQSSRISTHLNYSKIIYALYSTLYHNNIPVDIIPTDRDFSRYKILILTGQMHLSEEFIDKLYKYVENGGIILSYPQLSWRDEYNNYYDSIAPVGLNKLFGINSVAGTYMRDYTGNNEALFSPHVVYKDTTADILFSDNGLEFHGKAQIWIEDIELLSAEQKAIYSSDVYKGVPVISMNEYGKGKAIYFASFFDEDTQKKALFWALKQAGIEPKYGNLPKWVEVYERGEYIFVINHTDQEKHISISADSVIKGEYNNNIVILSPYDVAILKK